MRTRGIVLAMGCGVLALGCAERPGPRPDDAQEITQEIIDNLRKAGFPAHDIMVVDGVVYVGRDAEVTLAASREMLRAADTSDEQYRTTNLVNTSLARICVDGSTFTGVFSTALDLAIQNFEEQPLTFAMARAPTTGCSFTINAVIQPGVVGGSAGFPSGGLPFGTINIGGGLSTFPVDTIEHVITHELGHTIGFRHSDFFDRSISCGGAAINEGDGGVGAIHIPGTPTGTVVGGSIMNSCFRTVETGEFTGSDVTALLALYSGGQVWNPSFRTAAYSDAGGWSAAAFYWGTIKYPDLNGDGMQDICGRAGAGMYCALFNGSLFAAPTFWTAAYSDAGGWSAAQSHWGTIAHPDLNGDGRQDVCGRAGAGIYCGLSTGSSFTAPTFWTAAYSDPSGWAAAQFYWGTIKYPDLNGDGRQDICGRAGAGMYCALSTGSSFTAPTFWTAAYSDAGGWSAAPFYWSTIEHPDLNGDGRHDICGRAGAGIYCGLSTGSSFTAPTFWTAGYSDAGGWTGAAFYWATIKYADLNGDGRQDICGRAGAGMYCALSTGSSFTAPTFWTTAYSDAGGWSAQQFYWGTIEHPDLDGDGRQDICGRAGAGIYCGLSTGSSFTAPTFRTTAYSDASGWSAAPFYWGTIRYPDLNGDGKSDVCGRAGAGIYCAL